MSTKELFANKVNGLKPLRFLEQNLVQSNLCKADTTGAWKSVVFMRKDLLHIK